MDSSGVKMILTCLSVSSRTDFAFRLKVQIDLHHVGVELWFVAFDSM